MSKLYPKSNEDSIKWKVVRILTDEKGWKWDENLYGQQYSSNNKRIADLTCWDKEKNPLIVFEIKDKDKDLKKALSEQAVEWAIECGASIAYATDGSIIKTWHLSQTRRERLEQEFQEKNITDQKERVRIMFENGKPLILNGQEVEEFITEELAYKYQELDSNEYNTTDAKSIERTHEELVKIFASVNDKLRLGEGLGKGLQRFGEFCNLLFLKLVSEQEEKKEREGKKVRIVADYRWSSFRDFKEEKWLDHLKDTIWKHFQGKYGKDIFTPLKIKSPQTLQEIVRKLSPLSLSEIDVDIKGEAFEYFLKAYSKQKNNDLGEYFTPRHIVKYMINIANPQFGEKIYDPFCGTGGMLTESYKHIRKWMEENKESDWDKLQKRTIYGNDINEDSCRVAKMSMILLGDGQTNIHCKNSLNLAENGYNNEFDMIITNMPFGIGTYENTDNPYCYKHETLLEKNTSDSWRKEVKECQECLELLKAKNSENKEKREKLYKYYLKGLNINDLCVQHCFRAIDKNNPSSRIIMIVPQGILSSEKSFKKLREFIYKNSYVKYIISLPRKVFYADAKASILYLTNINPQLNDEEYVKEEKWKKREEQKSIWYYTIENTGYTLNAKREKKEGKNDLGEFLNKFCQIFENKWVLEHGELHKSLLNENFHELKMEEMKKNNYISIPGYYSNNDAYSSRCLLIPLSELVKETDERNTDKSASVWSITNDRGFVPSEENFKERVASKDISDYKLVLPNHFAYSPYRINVGSIN